MSRRVRERPPTSRTAVVRKSGRTSALAYPAADENPTTSTSPVGRSTTPSRSRLPPPTMSTPMASPRSSRSAPSVASASSSRSRSNMIESVGLSIREFHLLGLATSTTEKRSVRTVHATGQEAPGRLGRYTSVKKAERTAMSSSLRGSGVLGQRPGGGRYGTREHFPARPLTAVAGPGPFRPASLASTPPAEEGKRVGCTYSR